MFNKYTLQFRFKDQEDSYQKFIGSRVLRELLNFSIYATVFMATNLIQFLLQGSIAYSIAISISFLSFYAIWHFTKKRTRLINYVVLFYQLLITVGYELNSFVDPSERASQTFAWYYGYQCGFSHFIVYLQGSDYILHTIFLTVMNGLHLAQSPLKTNLGIMNLLMFLAMQATMAVVKYIYERIKREEFLYYQQQQRWQEILQSVISDYILLVRFDKKQDQLRLVQCSKMVQHHFSLQCCADMRQLLRDLKVTQSNFEAGILTNLEQVVRRRLLANTDFSKNEQSKLIAKNCFSKEVYKVKLLHLILENELMCLIVMKNQQKEASHSKSIEHKILREVTEQACLTARRLIQLQQGEQRKPEFTLETYFRLNFFLNVAYLINLRKARTDYETVSVSMVLKYIQNMFGSSQSFSEQVSNSKFKTNFQEFIQVITTAFDLVCSLNGSQPVFGLKVATCKQHVNLAIRFRNVTVDPCILNLLESNWIRTPERKFRFESDYKILMDRLFSLQKLHSIPLKTLLQVSVLQIIMASISELNHPRIVQSAAYLDLQFQFTNYYSNSFLATVE